MTDIQRHLELVLNFLDRGYAAGLGKAEAQTDTLKRKGAELGVELDSVNERMRLTGQKAQTFATDIRAGSVGFDDFKRRARELADEVEATGPKMMGLRDRGALLVEDFQKGKISTEQFRAGIVALDAASLGSLQERSGALAAEMRGGSLTLDDFKARARALGDTALAASPKMEQLRRKSAGLVEDLSAGRISPQKFREEIDKLDMSTARHKVNVDKLRSSVQSIGRDLVIGVAAATGFTIALFKLTELGAKVLATREAFGATLATAGLFPGALGEIKEAIRGVASEAAIMQASTRALNMGLDPSRLTEMWAKSRNIAISSGQDIREVFNTLTSAMISTNLHQLRTIGITIDTTEACRQYAASLGKTTEELNFRDRQMAISVALEEVYQKRFAAMGPLAGGVDDMNKQLGAGLMNLKDKFLGMIAASPAIQKFLGDLITKTDEWMAKLDKAGPAIDKVVTDITRAYKAPLAFGEDAAGPAIANIWKYRDAFAALAVTIGTGMFASKLMGIGVAMGLVTGTAAATVAGIAGAAAGLGTAMALEMKQSDKGADELNTTLRIQHDLLKQAQRLNIYGLETPPWNYIRDRIADLEAMNAAMKGQGTAAVTLTATLAKISAGATLAPLPAVTNGADIWGGPAAMGPPKEGENAGAEVAFQTEFDLFTDFSARKLEAYREYTEEYQGITLGREEWEIALQEGELEIMRRGIQERVTSYEAGYNVMGLYAARFYAKNAHMGRVLNAMLIAGMTEMVASYIEMKTKQARLDFMEASVQALIALARGDFRAASLYGQAAAGAAAIAGAGALAAGYIRNYGQQKAESMAEEDKTAEAEFGGGTTDLAGQRKQATGVVNTRPIHINVYSTANFNAGNMVFGDSEGAANDLYERCIRDKIEGDIESGMIAIPA